MGMLWKEDVTPEPSTSITIIRINQELILFLLWKGEGFSPCAREALTSCKSCSRYHYGTILAGKLELKGFLSILSGLACLIANCFPVSWGGHGSLEPLSFTGYGYTFLLLESKTWVQNKVNQDWSCLSVPEWLQSCQSLLLPCKYLTANGLASDI